MGLLSLPQSSYREISRSDVFLTYLVRATLSGLSSARDQLVE